MDQSNQSWIDRDLKTVWHPCTQMKDHEWLPLTPIKRAKGAWLYDFDGNRYLDAISSWWVNLFGHARQEIADRISEQAHTLEHVLLAGATHQPVIELAERLISLSPAGLDRVFFSDIGSAAVEVALKMSHHYWRNQGYPEKSRFITLSNAYHGETLGALGVGNVGIYRQSYSPLMKEPLVAPSPESWSGEPGESLQDLARRRIDEMRSILEQSHQSVAAVIVEPLIQCAGGMRMYDPIYLTLLRDLCDEYRVHLIADEVAVGFGRTGTLFACEQASIRPDFMCLSKGITGGFLPLAAVLVSEEIYQTFYDDYKHVERAFLHSHSYTGNPLACAAGLATLDLIEHENVIEANRIRARWLTSAAEGLRDHPHVGEVRQKGMVVAFELVKRRPKDSYPWQERRGLRVYQQALKEQFWLRPLGDVVYWMPPYVVTEQDVEKLGQVTRSAIDVATSD